MDKGTEIKRPHILVLEDDRAHRDLILRAFRDDPDLFRVTEAKTLLEARQVIESDPPDLIIADWILPDGKGLDILPRKEGKVTIPLIIMTSFGDEHLAVEIMKSGAIDYVVKSAVIFRELPHIAKKAIRDWENIQQRIRAEESVRESQKRLADIIGFLPDAVLAIDNKGRVIAWNTAIERMTGVLAEDMIGKGDHEYSLAFYNVRRPIIIDLVLEENSAIERKYDYIQRDGERITFETFIPTLFGGRGAYLWGTAAPLYDTAGNRIGAIEVIRDITDRKKAEKDLQDKENQLSTIFRNTPEILFLLHVGKGEHYRFLSVNQPFLDATGLAQEQVVGRDVREVIPEPSLTLVLEKYREAVAGRTTVTWEEITDYPAGRRYGEVSVTPLINAAGQCTNLVGSVHDITERRLADEKIRESERKYRFLLDNIKDIVWQTSPDLTFTYMSPAIESQTGYSPEDLIGTSVPGILTDPSARLVRRLLDERLEGYTHGALDSATVAEIEILMKGGGTRWFEISASPLYSPGGSLVGFQGISRDITERRRVETALIESEVRFRDLFNNMSAGVAIYDPVDDGEDFIFKDFNHAAEKIDKIQKEEVVGRRIIEVFPGVRDFGLFAVLQRVARTGIAESHPISAYHDNRITGWRENYVYKIPSGEVIAIYEDVTEKRLAEEEARIAREWLGTALRAARAGTWDWDIPAGQLTWSPEFFDLFGLSPTTIPSFEVWVAALHPDDREKAQAKIDQSIRDHSNLWNEYRIILPNGDIRWIGAAGSTTYNGDGKPLRMSGVCLDITSRKLAEERLRESEEKARSLMNVPMIGAFVIDRDGLLLDVNETILKGYKTTAEKILGTPVWDLYSPAVAERRKARVEEAIRSRQTVRVEENNQGKYYDVVITPLTDSRGNVHRVAVIAFDITGQKIAQNALAESESRFREIFNKANDGIELIEIGENGLPGAFIDVNDTACRMGQYTKEELLNKSPMDIDTGEYSRPFEDIIREIRTLGHATFETGHQRKDGTIYPIEINTHRITLGGKTVLLSIIRDITERKQHEEARKAYESRLDSAMEIGRLAWWEMDLPEGTVRFDDRKATLLGYRPEKFGHYSDFTTLLHPDDYEPVMKAMRDHLEGREARYHADYRILSGAGTYRWFRDVGGVTKRHPDGTPASMMGIAIDISSSKEAEEALRSTEIRFGALIQNSSDIIRILDSNGIVMYESPSSERILGYPPDYMVGKNPLDFIHPDDLGLVKLGLQEVMDRTNPGIPTEFRIRKADGEYLWVDAIASNLSETPGVNGIVVTTRPIQRRKEAEHALLESKARLETAMDIAHMVNWEFDVATGMFTFDDRFYALYGTTAEREGGNLMAAGTYLQEFVYPDDRPAVLASIRKILATTDPDYHGQIEHRIITRDGNVLTIIARFSPVMGPDGKVIRTHGANQDITQFKLMESEIRALNTVLEERVRDRTEALARTNQTLEEQIGQRQEAEKKLQKSFDEKVMLLKEVHHRVKNNLQIIVSLLNLQSRYIKDESSLSVIRESQHRIKAMALVHEKLYRAEDISHISLIDYIRFLGTGLFQFYDAKSRGIRFTLDIRDVDVDMDAAIPLGLILNELISNSLKYAFPGGRRGEIAICVRKQRHIISVVFRDDGIGIPPDLDWKETQSLGLRLVNSLVDQMDGTIELDRSAGTRFTMVLHEKE